MTLVAAVIAARCFSNRRDEIAIAAAETIGERDDKKHSFSGGRTEAEIYLEKLKPCFQYLKKELRR
ncbi:hypothetical protein [Ruegeria marina]|uniref:hypothetical protein n=1 Tax=Ruegeria marina TaxID=639004 RepID=UPI00115F84FD|nr:hypothetical protein [Ruegeria marina]